MDERRVTNFPIVDFLTPDNRVEHQRYPLAGQPNPKVTLRVVDVASGADSLVYDAARHDEYLAEFDWIRAFESTGSGDPRSTPAHDAGRCLAERARQSLLLYYQASPTWVDVQPLPFWISGGRSVWLLDRKRTAGIYLRARDGALRKISGATARSPLRRRRNDTAYFQGAYPTRRDRALLAIDLNRPPENLAISLQRPAGTKTRFRRSSMRSSTCTAASTIRRVEASLTPRRLTFACWHRRTRHSKRSCFPTRMLQVASSYGSLDAI